MCDPVTAVIAGSAILGAGVSVQQGSKARKQARQAQTANEAMAARQAQRSEEQFNRANRKLPGVAGLLASNKAGASRGIGSTFLTGAGGVPGRLPLGGAATLLGG